jgi:hypothetical protein
MHPSHSIDTPSNVLLWYPFAPLTVSTALPFTFLFLDVETAFGFLNDISMTLASDMATSMMIVSLFSVGMVSLAGVPFRERL